MIIIEFLGLLALGMFLVLIVIGIKNAIDAEITRMFIQKDCRKALVEQLYIIVKNTEEMKKMLTTLGLEEEDAEQYLKSLPREIIDADYRDFFGDDVPFDLDLILGEDEDEDEQ